MKNLNVGAWSTKGLVVVFAVFVGVAIVAPHGAHAIGAPTKWVDDDYTLDADCETGVENDGHCWGVDAFATIESAVTAATTNDIISVAAGTYTPPDTVHIGVQGLTLVGAGSGVSLVVSGGPCYEVFALEAPDITITGFAIMETDDGTTGGDPCLGGETVVGVDGLNYPGSNTASLSYNEIIGGSTGIYVASSSDAFVGNNDIHDNEKGLSLQHAPNGTVSDNLVYDNTVYGLELRPDGFGAADLTGTVISGNAVHDNPKNVFWYGFASGDVLFTGNEVYNGSTYGFDIEYESDAFIINENSIHDNAAGLYILRDSVRPPVNAVHNWWGDETGPTADDNPDGVGDSIVLDGSSGTRVYYRRFYTDAGLTTFSDGAALRDITIQSDDPDDVTRVHTGETVTLYFTSDPALVKDAISVAFTAGGDPVAEYTVASTSDDELNWAASFDVDDDTTSGDIVFIISYDAPGGLDEGVDATATTDGSAVTVDHATADLRNGATPDTFSVEVVLDSELTELGSPITTIADLGLILYGGQNPTDGTVGDSGATLSLTFSTGLLGTDNEGGPLAFGEGALADEAEETTSAFSITDSQITDHAGPRVRTTLGDGSDDVTIEDGDSGNIIFTETLSGDSQDAVEAALTAGSDQPLGYDWLDDTLTVSNDSGSTATFTDDVTADLTDSLDNTNLAQTLVDSAPVGLDALYVDNDWAGQDDVDTYNLANDTSLIWQTDAFAVIQDGIDAVADGGTVFVLAGENPYEEELSITASLTLEGLVPEGDSVGAAEGAPEIYDTLCTDGGDVSIISVDADNVTVEGFSIHSDDCGNIAVFVSEAVQNARVLNNSLDGDVGADLVGVWLDEDSLNADVERNYIQEYSAGIKDSGSSGATISDNESTANVNQGIYVEGNPSSVTISGNTASNNGHYGIFLFGSGGVVISGNTANGNSTGGGTSVGIFLGAGSDENTLTGNTANSNGIGFRLQAGSNGNTLTGNIASENGAGYTLLSSTGNTLTGNEAINNAVDGFWLNNNANDNELTGNVAADNTNGIRITTSSGITIDGNTIGRAYIDGEAIDANSNDGILIDSGSDITITNNQILDNVNCGSGIHLGVGAGEGNVAHYNNISGNECYGVDNESVPTFHASSNFWGSPAGPGADENNDYSGFVEADTWLTENSPQLGEDGSLGSLLTSGVFEYNGPDETDTDSVMVNGDVTLKSGNSAVTLLSGTIITPTEGGTFSVASVSATSPSLGGLSGFDRHTIAEGAFQWGIPNLGLTFNPAITVYVDVGADLNGQTLNILRSPNGTSGWTSDGIVPPATCTVADGICAFQATEASTYSPVTISSSHGSSGGYIGLAPTPTPLPPAPGLRPSGSLITYAGSPKVYVLEGGLKRWITTAEDFVRLGYSWASILVIPPSETYPDGANVGAGAPAPSAPTGPVTFVSFLTRGSTGPEVKALQEKLKALGFFPAGVATTTYFGPVTEAAVKAFQSAHGISPVGYVGPQTRAALNK